MVKAVILGGFWPRVARVHLPKSAIKFDKVQAGTIQRENTAKEFKFFDIGNTGERVFLHPASILFGEASWKSPFVTYFQKQATTKIFLRDATEVSLWFFRPSYFQFLPFYGNNKETDLDYSKCLGPYVCPPTLRWSRFREPHRRWFDGWYPRCFRKVKGMASNWDPRESITVCSLLPVTVTPGLRKTHVKHAVDYWTCNLHVVLRMARP